MKRCKFWLVLDIIMCAVFFIGSWCFIKFGIEWAFYENSGAAAFDFCAAIICLIMGLLWLLSIIPDDIKEAKRSKKDEQKK